MDCKSCGEKINIGEVFSEECCINCITDDDPPDTMVLINDGKTSLYRLTWFETNQSKQYAFSYDHQHKFNKDKESLNEHS